MDKKETQQMQQMFLVGAQVQQVVHPIRGKVVRYGLADDGVTMTHIVEYTDVAGETQQRHFTNAELEAVQAEGEK